MVYGGNPGLRAWLEQEEIPYVLAVACSEMIDAAAGPRRADELAALVPASAWRRLSCADGSKGPRLLRAAGNCCRRGENHQRMGALV